MEFLAVITLNLCLPTEFESSFDNLAAQSD